MLSKRLIKKNVSKIFLQKEKKKNYILEYFPAVKVKLKKLPLCNLFLTKQTNNSCEVNYRIA